MKLKAVFARRACNIALNILFFHGGTVVHALFLNTHYALNKKSITSPRTEFHRASRKRSSNLDPYTQPKNALATKIPQGIGSKILPVYDQLIAVILYWYIFE